MVVPCMVNRRSYDSADTTWLFACSSWSRITSAIRPPTAKKKKVV